MSEKATQEPILVQTEDGIHQLVMISEEGSKVVAWALPTTLDVVITDISGVYSHINKDIGNGSITLRATLLGTKYKYAEDEVTIISTNGAYVTNTAVVKVPLLPQYASTSMHIEFSPLWNSSSNLICWGLRVFTATTGVYNWYLDSYHTLYCQPSIQMWPVGIFTGRAVPDEEGVLMLGTLKCRDVTNDPYTLKVETKLVTV